TCPRIFFPPQPLRPPPRVHRCCALAPALRLHERQGFAPHQLGPCRLADWAVDSAPIVKAHGLDRAAAMAGGPTLADPDTARVGDPRAPGALQLPHAAAVRLLAAAATPLRLPLPATRRRRRARHGQVLSWHRFAPPASGRTHGAADRSAAPASARASA